MQQRLEPVPERRARADGERLLVVQTACLGDVVLTTPLLRALRQARPAAHLTVLTTAVGAEALAGLASVDALWTLDKSWSRSGLAAMRRLLARLAEERFAGAVAAQRSFRTGLFLAATRAPLCVGFERAPGSWAYHRRIGWNAEQHAVRRYLALAEPFGAAAALADPRPELAVDPAAAARVTALLCAHGLDPARPIAALAPGSVWATKRWRADGFARVIEAAVQRGFAAAIVGSRAERVLCRQVAALARAPSMVLAGETGIRELIALLARARVVVANDSGAAHVAAALGRPVVAIFGPTTPEQGYVAWGGSTRVVQHGALACRPCGRHGPRRCPLGHHRCMGDLQDEAVVGALDAALVASVDPGPGCAGQDLSRAAG